MIFKYSDGFGFFIYKYHNPVKEPEEVEKPNPACITLLSFVQQWSERRLGGSKGPEMKYRGSQAGNRNESFEQGEQDGMITD